MGVNMKKLVLLAVVVGFVVGVVPAWGYSVGDTIVFSNTNGVTDVDSVLCTQSQFSFCIPADGTDLPAGSVVQVKRIKLASRHSEFSGNASNRDADSVRINLNGIRSDTYAFSSDTMAGKCTIAYSFSNPCFVVVGTTYTAEDAVQAGVGRGVTLCADNGNRMMSSNIDEAAVVHGKTASGSVMVNAKTLGDGIYPLYEVEAEFVSSDSTLVPALSYDGSATPYGASLCVSTNATVWPTFSGSSSGICVGPGGAMFVYDLGISTPNTALPAKNAAFSFALYADVSHVNASKGVILAFGKRLGGNPSGDDYVSLVLYREEGNLRLGLFSTNGDGVATAVDTPASVAVPSCGFHLIAGVCNPATGAVTLYVDTVSSVNSGSRAVNMAAGFQIGTMYQGLPSGVGFSKAGEIAVSKFYCYDAALTAASVDELVTLFPATDGTVLTGNIDDLDHYYVGHTLNMHTSSASGNMYLGVTFGTLNIPANDTVDVPFFKCVNYNTGDYPSTVNVAGTLNVTAEMNDDVVIGSTTPYVLNKGILLGHWNGTGTYNITGSVIGRSAYMETSYTAGAQIINVDGGTLAVKGIFAENANSTINLTNGGTIEVGRLLNVGTAITRNFGKGTYSILSSGNDVRPINFTATGDDATVIDVNGKEVQFAGAWTGGGNVTLKSSDADGAVSILEYAGSITVEDGVQLSMVTMDSDAYEFGKTFSNLKFKSGFLKLYYRTQEITSQLTSQTEGGVTTYTLPPQGKVWTGAVDGTFSDADNWQVGVPASGERFSIQASGAKTLSLDMASVVESPEVHVIGSGSLVIAGTGDGTLLAVTNLVIDGVAVTVNTAVFQPQTVTFLNGGSLAIGENGLLTDAVFTYAGALPTSGTAFTATTYDSAVTASTKWRGTIWLKDKTGLTSFTSNPYGNALSCVRLTGLSGWLAVADGNANRPFTNAVPVELVNGAAGFGFKVTDSISANANRPNGSTVFDKLKGTGTLTAESKTSNYAVYVVRDWSEWEGVLDLSLGKVVVFGDVMPNRSIIVADASVSGTEDSNKGLIYVMEGKSVTVKSDVAWKAENGVVLYGELKVPSLDSLTSGTSVYVRDTGTFTFMKTDTGVDDNSQNTDFGRVTGTGTIKYSGTGFCVISTNNFPTSMAFEAANGKGTVVPYVGAVVGSLSGSGDLRSDWESQSVRNLTILQATNTTWSGVFNYNYDRIDTVTVSPGVASSGTLTLAGTQTQENKLTIATNASVNITGKWVGPVSVAGTIAGTGTIDGALVVSDGATIKVNGADPLNMTGNVILSGDIAIVVADDVDVSQLTILSVTGNGATLDASLASFTVRNSSGEAIRARVVAKSKELRLSKGGFYIHLQ